MKNLAILLLTGGSLPRVTYLTRDWVHNLTIRVAEYIYEQSGEREVLAFKVFDWFRLPLTDAQWNDAGWDLGDIASPLVAQSLGVDFSSYDRIVFVFDQFNSHMGAWHATKPYLHLGAQDLTPALFAHEIAHMYGAMHSRLDLPAGLDEYGDSFCIMGGEGGKFSFYDENPKNNFAVTFGTNQWRHCNQCFGLFFDGSTTSKGTCAGAAIPGTGHHAAGFDFYLRHDTPPRVNEERDWRMCTQCLLLFHALNAADSVCPAGGKHTANPGGPDHLLEHDVPPGPGQPDWWRCQRCGSLFFAGFATKGRCAAGGGHQKVSTGFEYAIAHDIRALNETGPGMVAPTLLACGWLDLKVHGLDVGVPLRARPGGTDFSLRALQGAPVPGSPGAPVAAFADGLAEDQLVLEYRIHEGWDLGMPDAEPGAGLGIKAGAGWVLVHRTSATGPKTSLLVASIPARPAAIASISDAELRVRVAAVDNSSRAVTLRLDTAALPAPGDLVQKVVLPEESEVAPALASDGDHVFLAWTGTDGHLNLAVSADAGATFTGKLVSSETSSHAPALTSSGKQVRVAWTGSGGELNVAEVVATKGPPPTIMALTTKVTLPDTSPHAPGLAADGIGNLYLGWTGHDETLNLRISVNGGQSWAPSHTFKDSSSAAPALEATADGRLYMAWKAADGETLSAAWVNLVLIGDPPVLQVDPNISELARKSALPDTSDHAPGVASHRGRLHMAWTGEGDANLNLAGPILGTAGYGKSVFGAESSDAGPALARHRQAYVLAWRGSGNEQLNIATVRDRDLVLDDFRTGQDDFSVAAGSTSTRFQVGMMAGGRRMLRVTPNPGTDGARVHVDEQHRLAFTLPAAAHARLGGTLEVGYGWAADGTAGSGLGVNLHDAGADRISVELDTVAGVGVEVTVALFTSQGMVAANAFARGGTADFLFHDFSAGAPDLTAVSHVQVLFRVFDGHHNVVAHSRPTLRINGIEVRG